MTKKAGIVGNWKPRLCGAGCPECQAGSCIQFAGHGDDIHHICGACGFSDCVVGRSCDSERCCDNFRMLMISPIFGNDMKVVTCDLVRKDKGETIKSLMRNEAGNSRSLCSSKSVHNHIMIVPQMTLQLQNMPSRRVL